MKIIITESQYKRISEAIAGYDDFNMMATHGGKIMTHFFGFIKDLMQLFSGINEMLESEKKISHIDLKENLKEVIDVIDEITDAFKIGFEDFSEKNLIRSGMSLIKSLNRLKEKIQPLTIAGPAIVSNDQILNRLEKLSTNEGEVVEFDQVLLTNKDNEIDIGEPIVEGAKVQGKILNQTKNRTVIVFKKRRRQNSRRKKGHRQQISVVQIMKIFGKNGKLLSEASLEKKETVKTKEDKENKTVEKTTK